MKNEKKKPVGSLLAQKVVEDKRDRECEIVYYDIYVVLCGRVNF